MKKMALRSNISVFLWMLVIAQILFCLFYTGNHVLFNSNLKLWLNQDYFWYQKLQFMLGGDYQLSLGLAEIPKDIGILLVREADPWFINYYMLPRRMYVSPGVTNEAGLMKVPDKWIKEKGIDYVLLYTKSSVNILKVDKDIKFK
jgi:hypothetical protein